VKKRNTDVLFSYIFAINVIFILLSHLLMTILYIKKRQIMITTNILHFWHTPCSLKKRYYGLIIRIF